MKKNKEEKILHCRGDYEHTCFAESSFVSPFTENELNAIVEDFDKSRNTKSFDGQTVRIEQVSENETILSLSSFYYFVASNLLVSSPVDSVPIWAHDRIHEVIDAKTLTTADAILQNRYLANVLATSVLIEDCEGFVALASRNVKSTFSSAPFAVSGGGSLLAKDCLEGNPFINCARREILEELGISVSPVFDELIIAKQKFQPVATLHVTLPISWKALRLQVKKAVDYHLENKSLVCMQAEQLPYFLANYSFTDTAHYQLSQYLAEKGISGIKATLLSKKKPVEGQYFII